METARGAAGRTPRFLASCYKERKEAKQPPLLSGLSQHGGGVGGWGGGGLDSPVPSPRARSTNKGGCRGSGSLRMGDSRACRLHSPLPPAPESGLEEAEMRTGCALGPALVAGVRGLRGTFHVSLM